MTEVEAKRAIAYLMSLCDAWRPPESTVISWTGVLRRYEYDDAIAAALELALSRQYPSLDRWVNEIASAAERRRQANTPELALPRETLPRRDELERALRRFEQELADGHEPAWVRELALKDIRRQLDRLDDDGSGVGRWRSS